MRSRLIILSDLWGIRKAEWIQNYLERLKSRFEIKYYDCCELGDIDVSNYRLENLHQQFIDGGIERAVKNIIDLEKEKVTILAFSIGGVIAWKAALQGLNINNFYAISATRLRFELQKPKGNIYTFWGELDDDKPNKTWFVELYITSNIAINKGHNMYMDIDCAKIICDRILF